MEKVESADSIALGESHQSTEKLDRNDCEKKKSTIQDKFNLFISPILLSSHEPLPQNSTHIQEIQKHALFDWDLVVLVSLLF